MPTKYTDIEQYKMDLPEWMKAIFQEIRMLILTFPEVMETIRYNTPFYDAGGKMMLYLGLYKKNRLILGFVNGNLMKDESGVLKNENKQSQIRHFEFQPNTTFEMALLVEYIAEAIQINVSLKEPQHVTKRKRGK